MTLQISTDEPPIALGDPVHLSRWVQTTDGWETETIVGEFVGHILDAWILNTSDGANMYPDQIWERTTGG